MKESRLIHYTNVSDNPLAIDGSTFPDLTVPMSGKDGSGNAQDLLVSTAGELQVGLVAATGTNEVVGDVAEDANAAGNPVLTGGRFDSTPRTLDDTDVGAIAIAVDGAVHIDDGGNAITVDWAGTAPPVGAGTEAAALRVTLATDSTGLVSIDDGGGNISTDWAGTVPPVGAGTEAAALRVTLATDSTGLVSIDDGAGSLTVDSAAAFTMQEDGAALTALQVIDNCIYVDDADWTDSTSSHALVGGLYQSTPQTVTDGDVAPFNISVNGAAHALEQGGASIGPGNPVVDSYTQISINLAAAADQVLVSSSANKQIWVYGYQFTVNVAGTVSFQDEDNVAISGIMNFAANGGAAISPSGNFAQPIWKLGTNKDLEVDVVTSEIDGWLSYAIVDVS